MNNDNMADTVNYIGDTISLTTLFGYFLGGLPTVALLLTVFWTAIRLWETKTVQGWFGRK